MIIMDKKLKAWHRKQIETYRKQELPAYEVYAETLRVILAKATSKIDPLAIVQARAKTISSFAEKAIRKKDRLDDPVHQLTDLCGARVICTTVNQMERVSDFIRQSFFIDEENSQDVATRLRTNEFGYRSLHFVVQLNPGGKILGVPIPRKIGQRKAEIQVRTFLQHAWADISHDRLYKTAIDVPDTLERKAARLSAILEEAEASFTDLVEAIDAYACDYGGYMDKDRMRDEMVTLATILENEPEAKRKASLALRIAAIAKAAGDWTRIVAALQPYSESDTPAVLRELGNAKCRLYRDKPKSVHFRSGRNLLEKAAQLDPQDTQAFTLLAEAFSYQPGHEEVARRCYRRAFELAPDNPYHLAAFLESETSVLRSGAAIAASIPALRVAVGVCRSHVEVGIALPKAYFTMGKLQLLLGESHPSLFAYCKAIAFCVAEKSGVPEEVLDAELEALRRLEYAKDSLPGPEWNRRYGFESARRLLLLAKSVKFHPDRPLKALRELKQVSFESGKPVLMIAGGCDTHVEPMIEQYRAALLVALVDFEGLLFCGGTKSGISGVIGSVTARIRSLGRRSFKAIAYLPAKFDIDSEVKLDKQNYQLIKLEGHDFSPLEPLQAWIDLVSAEYKTSEAKLLAINGGPITAFEIRLALALGASVAVIPESGRAAAEIAQDPEWRDLENLLKLPYDTMTLRAFINPRMSVLSEKDRERAGKAVHAKYCSDNKHKTIDPSMRPWDELSDSLRKSNLAQADYAAEILKKVGYGLREKPPQSIRPIKFTPKQVETMAEMEHGRWNVERLADGWRYGPKDVAKKTSPYLVPWNRLTEDIKDYDRKAVCNFPNVLKEAGFEVYRLSSRGSKRLA